MLDKIKRTIKKHDLIEYGDHIIIGVSGGHDSVCLFHALWTLREEFNLKLTIVNLDHQYRGEASRLDSRYVVELGRRFGVEVYAFSENVEAYSKLEGISFEEAGRKRRYGLFFEVLHNLGGNKVAVAHNRNDQVETVLMRIMRGTGIDGMCGIPYKRHDGVIRPLLDVDRKLIEEYCETHDLKPRTDHTNLDNVYTRNKIRLDLIPYIEKEFNKNFQSTLLRNIDTIQDDVEYLELKTKEALEEVFVKEDTIGKEGLWVGDRKKFIKKHLSIQRRMLRMLVTDIAGGRWDLSYKQVQSLLEMIQKGKTGKSRVLKDLKVATSYDEIIVSLNDKLQVVTNWEYLINEDGFTVVEEAGIKIKIEYSDVVPKNSKKYTSGQRIVVDADKIKGSLTIRNKKDGDRFTPFGMKGTKKIKDYFIDQKINRDLRSNMPILCDEQNIVWVVGYRMSNIYGITDKTRRVLIIETELL